MLNTGIEGSAFSEVQEPAAIIIGPTRELVVQINNEARKFANGTMLRPCVVYGGTSVMSQLGNISKGAHIVTGTPGRLLDFISKGKLGLGKLKYLVLDEADRMLDMGFKPDIERLLAMPGMPSKDQRQTLLFSATFPTEIQQLAGDILNDYLFITVGKVGGANSDIEQRVFQVNQMEKRDKLVSILNETGRDRTLVFVETKKGADFLATYLSQSEFPATSIHGDRLQNEREEALRDFKTGRAPILIATSVAARGLDIPGVEHVVNYDLPKEVDEYVHRIGRTGRCGNLGKATSFFDPGKDGDIGRTLVKILSDARQEVPDWLDEIAQGSFGGSFAGGSGDFGGRDTRKGKFGGGGGGGFDDFGDADGFGATNGGGGGMGFSTAADDDWD
jgi:probable ATP-dependent RNA helicase DDX4